MKRRNLILFSIFALFFISCSDKERIINLSNNISYYEANQYTNFYEIRANEKKFTFLPSENKSNLSKLLKDKNNLLWLKVDFTISDELNYRSLGLYIAQLRTASEIWLNGHYIGSSGEMPPYEFTSGYGAHYYFLQDRVLNFDKNNTLYIKIWPGSYGIISDTMYITETKVAQKRASLLTFFNSKIFIAFAILLLFQCFYYVLLFLMQKNQPHNICYLMFSAVCFFSFVFLIPFFASEIPWINIAKISHLTFMKLAFCCGAYFTVYFVKSFINNLFKLKLSAVRESIRIIILVFQIIITVMQPSFSALIKVAPFVLATIGVQILFIIESLFIAFISQENRKKSLKIFVGFIPVLLSVIIDLIFRIIVGNKNLPYITLYGWQFTLMTFVIFLIVDFNKMFAKTVELSDELQNLNQHLEDEIQKRTADLTQTNIYLAEQINRSNEDLRTAKYVQQELLPVRNTSFNGWDISVAYQPLNNVSGNLYDYFSEGNFLEGIGLFDVSDHGTAAGLFTMLAKNLISQSFSKSYSNNKTASEILFDINENLTSTKNRINKQIFGEILKIGDIEQNNSCRVEISSASMPDCILYDSRNESVKNIEIEKNTTVNEVLGNNDPYINYNQNEFRMYPEDTIVLFTKGLINSENIAKNQFEIKSIENILKRYKFDSAQRILTAIMSSFENFIGNSSIKDDITVIVLKRDYFS